MPTLSKRDRKIFFDVMAAALTAGLGAGKLSPGYVGNEPAPASMGRRSIEWQDVPAWEGAIIERLSLFEDQDVYFWAHCRFATTFDRRHHSRFNITCERRGGSVYGCTKWNLACHGNAHPLVSAHVILQQMKLALLPDAFALVWAEFSRQSARRGEPVALAA